MLVRGTSTSTDLGSRPQERGPSRSSTRPPRKLFATIPEGTAEDVDRAVAAAAAAFPALGGNPARRAGQVAAAHRRGARGAHRRAGPDHLPRSRHADDLLGRDPSRARRSRLDRGSGRHGDDPMGGRGRQLPGGVRARGGRRSHHPVELSALSSGAQGGPGSGRRLHGGAQAQRGGTGKCLRACRGDRRDRPSVRGLQSRERASDPSSAKPSRRTRTSTWCRSPAPRGPGGE